MIAAVSSVERSSTTTTSIGSYSVASTDRTQASMFAASFRAGMMTEIKPPRGCGA